MTIIRVDKSSGRWEAIPVALINDSRLSLDTRGFAAWLMTRGENWEVQAGALPRLLDIGREKSQRLIRELERAGYLARSCAQGANGRWLWSSTFSPVPSVDGFPVNGRTGNGSSVRGPAVNGKPVDIDKTRKKTRHRTTTTGEGCRADDDDAIDLEVPSVLSGDFLASARRQLRKCPAELQQAVLDEVAGLADRQAIRGNPLALLASLVDLARRDEFSPAEGSAFRRRSAQRQRLPVQADAGSAPKAPLTEQEREAIKQRLAALRSKLVQPKEPAGVTRGAERRR